MSDVPPPSLRLKPRARLDGDTPAVAETIAQPAAVTEATNDTSEAPKLRLRPKLDLSSVTPVTETPADLQPQVDVEPVKTTFSLKPRKESDAVKPLAEVSVAAVIPPAAEPPKFKLKEKAPLEAVPPLPAGSPTQPAVEPAKSPSTPPPFLVAEKPALAKPTAALPPPVPKLNAKRIIDDTSADSHAAPGKSSAKLAVYVLAVLLMGGGFFAYLKLKPKPAPAAPVVTETPKRPSTPSATLNELSTVPARAIQKAEETIATVNATEQGRVEAVVDGDQSATFQPRRKPAPKPVAKPVVTSTTELAPGIKATTTATDNVGGDASNEFRTWVAQARVSGVFQGTPPRVLINGRTVSATQVVDETLQITFDGIDATTKSLVFRDHTGATVSRKF